MAGSAGTYWCRCRGRSHWTALNEQLLEGCRRRLGDRLRGHDETIGERLVRDLEAFHGLPPAPYDACEKKAGSGQFAIAGALSRHRLFGAHCLRAL